MPARTMMLILALLLFPVLSATPAQAVAVAGAMRVLPDGEALRLRVALSEPLGEAPSTFVLDQPKRVVVDLPGASAVKRSAEGAGAAEAARMGQFDPETVRVVVDLLRPMKVAGARMDGKTLEVRLTPTTAQDFEAVRRRGRRRIDGFTGPAAREHADRMAGLEARIDAVSTATADTGQPAGADVAAVTPVRSATPKPRKTPVIVVDAGHGGKDPGAPNVAGGSEKETNLAIAIATKAAIETRARQTGFPVNVLLTRSDDRFITLTGRVQLARAWGASLFVSIHADSAPNPEARGASVYTLSDQASDKEAARLAAKENRADLIAGVDLSDEDREVSNLLIDLSMRDSMNASADFAEQLQAALKPQGVHFRSEFHHFAGFRVLRNLGVPAVLLETGYVSNVEDAKWLKSKKGQQAIARGIANASVEYLRRNR